MGDFVHLHLHTEYSLLDGAAKIDQVFGACKDLGMDAVAITDHGNMFGTLYFAECAKKAGIRAIIGCELYLTEDMHRKNGNGEFEHLVLLAKNKQGYKSLVKLDSIAYVDGFYYKPRIDYKLLAEHSEGLICLSACLAGRIPRRLLAGDYEGAKSAAEYLHGIFGEDFYLEIQDHGLPEQKRINPLLVKLGKELGIKLVATNDVHYIRREDSEMQDVMLCIQTKKTIDDPDRMRFSTDQFYLKSAEEMRELFPYCPEAISNTLEIRDKCTEEVFDLTPKGQPIKDMSLIPGYQPPNGMTPREYLSMLTEEGLKKRYKEITPEIRRRADYELDTIDGMGFSEYYLIVWDFINYARSVGIPVGAGRGSGVGSIIAYAVGITDVDPLRYSLIFERFLNKERVSMPDFDIDFCNERRPEVIEYVKKKYGEDKVAQIVTFGTLASKAAIKDVARVYKVPFADVNRVTNLMDGKASIAESLGFKTTKDGDNVMVRDLREIYDEDEQMHHVIDMAMKLENMPRNTSMHAAGVVICRKVISDHVPLQRNGEDITTQFDKTEVEELGMLKMDFLALRTLTDIKKATDYILEDKGVTVDFMEIGYENQAAYDLIGEGDTDAVFQLESTGMKKFMRDLRPTNLEEIIAGIALYRPGPMQFIDEYLQNSAHPEKITYLHPMLEPILSVTRGVIIYQEQVMQIVQQLAGFSLGQADIIRRAMSKKNDEEMARQSKKFIFGEKDENGSVVIEGAIARGVPEDVARTIFDKMTDFAKYAFNKSHAAAYAVLAYQTAYLKKFYPHEFLAAILNNRIDKIEETTKYITYLREKNIPVLPPDINKSKAYFSVEDNRAVRFGLAALKNVGIGAIGEIIAEREKNGPFKDFVDFIMRCNVKTLNKRMVENMILAGVFDCFGVYRSRLVAVHEELMDRAALIFKQRESAQMSLFGDIIKEDNTVRADYPEIPEYDSKVRLSKEKAVIGVYVTGHPLENYRESFRKFTFTTDRLADYEEDEDGNRTYGSDLRADMPVYLGGIVSSFRRVTTKSNRDMGVFVLEDLYGSVECVMFPKVYDRFRQIVAVDEVVAVTGKLQIREGDPPSVSVDRVEKHEMGEARTEAVSEPSKKTCLALRISEENEPNFEEILDILGGYEGDIPVFIARGGKKFRAGSGVRRCAGLQNELMAFLNEKEIVFFEK